MKKDLKSFYKQTIVPSLIADFGYKNIEQVEDNLFYIENFRKR